MILLMLLAAVLASAQVVTHVVVGTETYIAVRINATGQIAANFSALAYANSSGVYVVANPPTQYISCLWDGRWFNGTGAVAIPDPSAEPVCWFRGFPYPVSVAPIREHVPPFPFAQYLWIVGMAPVISALFWRRIEVAGIASIVVGIINAWAYPLWGYSASTAVSVSVLMIVLGVVMILASRGGE